MSTNHRLRKGCLGLLIVGALLLASIPLALHVAPSLGFVRTEVESLVESALQAELSVGDLGGSLLGEVTAEDVELFTLSGERIARVDSLSADLSWGALIRRDVEVDIAADGLELFIARAEDGTVNLLSILPPEDEEPPTESPISLDLQFDVSRLNVVWRDRGVGGDPGFEEPPSPGQLRSWVDSLDAPQTIARAAPEAAALADGSLRARVVVARDSTTDVGISSLSGDLAAAGITAARALELSEFALKIESEGERTEFAASLAKLRLADWLAVERLAVVIDPARLEEARLSLQSLRTEKTLLRGAVPEFGAQSGLDASVAAAPHDGATRLVSELQPLDGPGRVRVTARLEDWVEVGPGTSWSAALAAEGLRYSEISEVAAPLTRGDIFVDVEGSGVSPDQMTARARVGVRDAEIDRYRLNAAYLEARLEAGVVEVDRVVAESPYVAATVAGEFSFTDGGFGVRARMTSSDDVAEVGQRLFGREIDTRADARLDVDGTLDLQAEDPLALLRAVDGRASWSIRDFVAEDVRVGETRGRVTFGVSGDGGRRRVRYDVDASGRRIRADGFSLGSFAVRSNGRSTVQLPSIDPRNALGGLVAELDVDVDGMVWDGSLLRSADALVKVRPRRGRLAYDISASVQKAALSGVQIGEGAVRLSGDVKLGRRLAWPGAVSAASARGDAALTGLRLDGDSAGTLDVKLDVAGPLDDLGGEIDVSAADLALAGYRFRTLTADLSFTGDREFRIDAEGEQVDAEPKNLGILIRGRYRRDFTDFTILELRFTSAGDAWQLSDGFSVDTKTGTLRFDDVTLSRDGQEINVDGVFRPGKSQDLRVDIESVDLGGLDEQFGIAALEPLRGRVSGEIELGGTAKRPTATFSIRLVDVYWEEYGPFDIVLEGRYGERQLVLERAEIDGYGSRLLQGNATLPVRIQTDGEFDVLTDRKLDLFFEADEIAVAGFYSVVGALQEWGAAGGISYRVKAKGTLEDPIVQARVDGSELYARREENGQVFEVGPARLDLGIDYLSPDNPRGGFDGTASLSFRDAPPFEIRSRLRAPVDDWLVEYLQGEEVDWVSRFESVPWSFSAKSEQFDLRNVQLGALRDADAEGFVTIDVNGEGTIARPQMSVDVELDEFGWERYRDIVLVLDADVTTERVEVNELSLEWDADDILSASGTIPAPFDAVFGDGELGALPIDFTAELQPLPLRKFSAIDYTFASLRGQVGGYVALGGTLREPRIDGRFSAIDIEVSDRTRGTIATEVSYAEGEANADLIVCSGPREMLLGSATVPVPLDFVKIASGEPIEVAGDIQGTLKGERVHLARLLPRKIFDEYVSSLGGMMAVDLTVDGTVEQPTLDGTLRVTDGEVFIGEFARAFEDIKVDLQASPGELELRDFYVGDRNGYVDAKGTLQVDGIKPGRVDARVSLDQFGTSGFTDFPTFITANIDVGGDFSGNGARAEARVADLEVVVPDTSTRETYPTQLDADIVVLREGRRSEMEDIFEIDGFDGATREKIADLRVIVERDSWVRHPQGQVEVMGDITVEVIGTTVRLGGEIETVRGSAEVLGKRFDIAKGLITFTGADPPDPRLQVEAVYEFDRSITRAIGRPTSGEPRAIVRVTGRTSNPQIRFLSDPQMPESDVIYALITGQPPNQQEVGQTQGGGLAAGVASGLAAGLLEDKLGEILPVKFDVFRLEAGDEGFADPSVEVGKYIFEDVFFSIEYKIGAEPNENTSEFNIEYRFLPRWIFEFTAGNLGTGEANIFWEIF